MWNIVEYVHFQMVQMIRSGYFPTKSAAFRKIVAKLQGSFPYVHGARKSIAVICAWDMRVALKCMHGL